MISDRRKAFLARACCPFCAGSDVTSRQKIDFFGRVPLRFQEALRRGEISFEQFGIGAFLAVECFMSATGAATYTLTGLREALAYRKQRDALRRNLEALRPAWIEFDVRERQRKAITFRLTGLAVESPTAASDDLSMPQSRRLRPQSPLQSRGEALDGSAAHEASSTTGVRGSRRGSDPLLSHLILSGEDSVNQSRGVALPVEQAVLADAHSAPPAEQRYEFKIPERARRELEARKGKKP